MSLVNLPKDVLVELAVDMTIIDVINLCKADKQTNMNLCQNNVFWMKKLDKDYPQWKKLNENNLQQVYSDLFKAEKIPGLEDVYDKYYMIKLENLYPDTDWEKVKLNKRMEYDDYYNNETFYVKVINTINDIKNKFKFRYTDGNPFIQHLYFRQHLSHDVFYGSYYELLKQIIETAPSFSIVKRIYDIGVKLTKSDIKKFLTDWKVYGMETPYFLKNDKGLRKIKEFLDIQLKNF